MADIHTQAKYERKRIDVIAKLKRRGFEANFGKKTTVNSRGGTGTYSETCKEWYFPTDSETFKDIIESGESVYMVSNEFNQLKGCGFMNNLGRSIRSVKPFPEGLDKPIYYEILVKG